MYDVAGRPPTGHTKAMTCRSSGPFGNWPQSRVKTYGGVETIIRRKFAVALSPRRDGACFLR